MKKEPLIKLLREFRGMGYLIMQHENDKILLQGWLEKVTDPHMPSEVNEELINNLNEYIAYEQTKIDELKEKRKQVVLLLKELEPMDSKAILMLKLKYIGGLTQKKVARCMQVSEKSVTRYHKRGLGLIEKVS